VFTLEDLKRERKHASTMLSILLSFRKFQLYETRDPFSIHCEIRDRPDYSDWDRYAMYEYIRLSSEEQEGEVQHEPVQEAVALRSPQLYQSVPLDLDDEPLAETPPSSN
jgi:hypothetical protein